MLRRNRKWRLAQRLEGLWWQRYLAGKHPQDYLKDKRRYWNALMQRLDWDPQVEARSVEFGCGPAGIFLNLEQQHCTAIDPLIHYYQASIDWFRPAAYPWVRFVNSPMELYQPDGVFDECYCLNAINHVADWRAALQVLTRATRPGGRLLLGVDVHRWELLCRLFRLVPADVLHPQQHRRTDYCRALEELGWQIEQSATWKRGYVFDFWIVRARRISTN